MVQYDAALTALLSTVNGIAPPPNTAGPLVVLGLSEVVELLELADAAALVTAAAFEEAAADFLLAAALPLSEEVSTTGADADVDTGVVVSAEEVVVVC